MLSESEAAFYSFGAVMLLLYLVPAGIYTSYRLYKQPKAALRSNAFQFHLAIIVILIALLWQCLRALEDIDISGVFDPYDILGVTMSTSIKDIKRKYRRMGRELHPDKNPSAQAAAQFQRLTKAYEALTDARGIENYKKYGHPDGKQSILMNFAGLSDFGDSNGSIFVLLYFIGVFVGLLFLVYYVRGGGSSRDRTHVSKDTRQKLVEAVKNDMSVQDIAELLLSTPEMARTSSEKETVELQQRSKAHEKVLKKIDAAKALPAPAIARIKKCTDLATRENLIALYCFLRRHKLPNLMKPDWLEMRTRRVVLELPFLLDLFADVATAVSVQRGYKSTTVERCVGLLAGMMQGSLVADDQALQEQLQRLSTAPPSYQLVSPSLCVVDEDHVRPGDYLTLSLQLVREHLDDGDSAPLAASVYDQVDPSILYRKEHVYFLVTERKSRQLLSAWKCNNLNKTVDVQKVFQGPFKPAKYQVEIQAMSMCYLDVSSTTSVPLEVEMEMDRK